MTGDALARLVGDDLTVPCVDGVERRYISLDAANAATSSALPTEPSVPTPSPPSWTTWPDRGEDLVLESCWKGFRHIRGA